MLYNELIMVFQIEPCAVSSVVDVILATELVFVVEIVSADDRTGVMVLKFTS